MNLEWVPVCAHARACVRAGLGGSQRLVGQGIEGTTCTACRETCAVSTLLYVTFPPTTPQPTLNTHIPSRSLSRALCAGMDMRRWSTLAIGCSLMSQEVCHVSCRY